MGLEIPGTVSYAFFFLFAESELIGVPKMSYPNKVGEEMTSYLSSQEEADCHRRIERNKFFRFIDFR